MDDWNTVIPNIRKEDIVYPLKETFKERTFYDGSTYGGIKVLADECAIVKRMETQKMGIYHKTGKQIIPEEFDEIKTDLDCIWELQDENHAMLIVKNGSKYGVYWDNGEVAVPVQYAEIREIRDGLVILKSEEGLYGVYSVECGKMIAKCEYDDAYFAFMLYDDDDTYIIIKKGEKYGLISEEGKLIVPIEYRRYEYKMLGHEEGFLVYGECGVGWYPINGTAHIPCKFCGITEYYSSTIGKYFISAKTSDGKIGIYSMELNEIIPPEYKSVTSVGKYLVAEREDGEISVFDAKKGQLFSTKK